MRRAVRVALRNVRVPGPSSRPRGPRAPPASGPRVCAEICGPPGARSALVDTRTRVVRRACVRGVP